MPNVLSPSSKAGTPVALVTRSMSKARPKDKWISYWLRQKDCFMHLNASFIAE